jgi:hypothetical protein
VAFLLVTNVVLLAAGNFMDPAAITLIMAPILFPMAAALGVHPVHLGILMAVNMEVGLCHPPVGLNLYVASGITKMGITETIAVPWYKILAGDLRSQVLIAIAARKPVQNSVVRCWLASSSWLFLATNDWIKALGDGFVKLIRMVIAPIIFCTVVSGISHIRKPRRSAASASRRWSISRSSRLSR